MKDTKWPRWRFHKEKKPEGMIVNSLEENEALGAGWVDSPTLFEVVLSQKVDEQVEGDEQHEDTASMKVPELKAELIRLGKSEDELKGLKKAELVAMLEAI